MGFKIWKHQDSGNPNRLVLNVMVDNGPNHTAGKLEVHLSQGHFDADSYEAFTKEALYKGMHQVVLSVSDLSKLMKEIRQAAREIRKGRVEWACCWFVRLKFCGP